MQHSPPFRSPRPLARVATLAALAVVAAAPACSSPSTVGVAHPAPVILPSPMSYAPAPPPHAQVMVANPVAYHERAAPPAPIPVQATVLPAAPPVAAPAPVPAAAPAPAPATAALPPVTTTIVEVREPPPAPIVEKVVVCPGPNYVWIGGRWVWGSAGWAWAPGYWSARPYSNAFWIEGRWTHKNTSWVWVGGRWR